jgi:hypothetical protein
MFIIFVKKTNAKDTLQHMNKNCFQRCAIHTMRLLTLTLLLFLTQTLFGQLQTDLKSMLALKDFQSFKKYADNLPNRNNHITTYWQVEREIASGFQERILTVRETIPDTKNPGHGNNKDLFRLQLWSK